MNEIIKRHPFSRVLLFLSLSTLIGIVDFFPNDSLVQASEDGLTQQFEWTYHKFLDHSIGGPYMYRFLVPLCIHWSSEIFQVHPLHSTLGLNILFTFALFWGVYMYAKQVGNFRKAIESVFITGIYLVATQVQFFGVHVVESQDLLNLVVFAFVLYLLKKERWWSAGILIALGILNRETPIFLLIPLGYFSWKAQKPTPAIVSIVFSIGMYAAIRIVMGGETESDWMQFDKISKNIPFLSREDLWFSVKSNALVLFYFMPLIALFLIGNKQRDSFSRVIVFMCILFIVTHYFVGTILELRLFLPVVISIVPILSRNLNFHAENTPNLPAGK